MSKDNPTAQGGERPDQLTEYANLAAVPANTLIQTYTPTSTGRFTGTWGAVKVGAIARNSGVGNITAATANITAADDGKIIVGTSATDITLTVAAALPLGFQCSVIQGGEGAVIIEGNADPEVTIENRQDHDRTNGQYARIDLVVTAENTVVLSGDTAGGL